jgi:uncharacterized membrane protein
VWFSPRSAPAATAARSGPEVRLERAAAAREAAVRRGLGMVGLVVVALLAIAFVQGSRVPDRPPAEPLVLTDGVVQLSAASLSDGHMHFFEVMLPERPLRIFAIDVDGEIRTCFDACEICGDIGYFEEPGSAVCRNCTSPIALTSLGRTGGCNPIPLPHRREHDTLSIMEADLRAVLPVLEGQ